MPGADQDRRVHEGLLPLLACPTCRGDLRLLAGRSRGTDVVDGELACPACSLRWPIVEGVPDFVGSAAGDPAVERTTRGFARNWNAYREAILADEGLNRRLLEAWVAPLDLTRLRGRLLLDVGCGMGRWMRAALAHGPAAVVGVDYSQVAHTAWEVVREAPNAHVIRADLFRLPLRPCFDLAWAIGVLHHTPDPDAAFGALASRLDPAGVALAWVYGAEGNGWITRWVTPLRERVSSRLPHPLLAGLTHALSPAVWAAARVAARLPEGWPLPSREYLAHLRVYPYAYLEHIVYDQLVPTLASSLPSAAERPAPSDVAGPPPVRGCIPPVLPPGHRVDSPAETPPWPWRSSSSTAAP